jgi:cytoskeletal protein CcmA (bactofilin family)
MFSKSRTDKPVQDDPMTTEQHEDDPGAVPALGLLRRPETRNTTNINTPSIISAGFELVGDLVSTGVVQVEGTVRGNLRLSAVTIGNTGEVVGTIECKTLHIKGRFLGQARCEEMTLSADAYVDGAVSYTQMSAQRGARIKGELIKNPGASSPIPPPSGGYNPSATSEPSTGPAPVSAPPGPDTIS